MRITALLDDRLMDQARRLTGQRDTAALLTEALRSLIQRESAHRLIALGGTEPMLNVTAPRRADRGPAARQGWAEDARRLAEHGDDTLIWPALGN